MDAGVRSKKLKVKVILSTWILPVEFLFANYPNGKIKRLCFCVQYQFESAERTQYNQLVEAEVYAAQTSFQYPQSRIDLRIFPMQFSVLYANDSSHCHSLEANFATKRM